MTLIQNIIIISKIIVIGIRFNIESTIKFVAHLQSFRILNFTSIVVKISVQNKKLANNKQLESIAYSRLITVKLKTKNIRYLYG